MKESQVYCEIMEKKIRGRECADYTVALPKQKGCERKKCSSKYRTCPGCITEGQKEKQTAYNCFMHAGEAMENEKVSSVVDQYIRRLTLQERLKQEAGEMTTLSLPQYDVAEAEKDLYFTYIKSLFPDAILVPVERVRPSAESQPRQIFKKEDAIKLAESIDFSGQLQITQVRQLSGGSEHDFEIIDGERRWRAAKDAGKKFVPVVRMNIKSPDIQLMVALVLNFGGKKHLPIETADVFKKAINFFGYSASELAVMIGQKVSWVKDHLALFDLCERGWQLLAEENEFMTFRVAVDLAKYDKNFQEMMIKKILKEKSKPTRTKRLIKKQAEKSGNRPIRGRKQKPSDYRARLTSFFSKTAREADDMLELLDKAMPGMNEADKKSFVKAADEVITKLKIIKEKIKE